MTRPESPPRRSAVICVLALAWLPPLVLSACGAEQRRAVDPLPGAGSGAVMSASASSSASVPAASDSVAQGASSAVAVERLARPRRLHGGVARGGDSDADLALLEGDRALDRDDYPAARKHYARAGQLNPADPSARVGLVRVKLAELGLSTDYNGAPGNARLAPLLTELDQILKGAPKLGCALLERGRILLMLGRAPEALSSLRAAILLTPGDAEVQTALGVGLLAIGQVSPAIEAFKMAVELDPANAARLTNLGTSYMMLGRVEEAIRVYVKAVELAPKDARIHGNLGTAYLGANRPSDALSHLERAVALDPSRATYLSNLGYAYQQAGRLPQAVTTYERAIKLDPKLVSAWINLGTARAQQGDLTAAEQALRQAERLDPSDPRVKANLAELDELRKKPASKGK